MKFNINSEQFKKYFFHGIENKEEAKEGILCFSSTKIYKMHSCENWYEIPNEQFENEIIEEATKKYKHFYRFVVLNDENNNFTYHVNIDEIKQELREKLEKLKEEGKVIVTKAGVFFTSGREAELKGGKTYIHGQGLVGEEGWTKQIYDILNKLDMMEKEEKINYYEYWLLTKFARAINKFNREEALEVKNAYRKFCEIKNTNIIENSEDDREIEH